MSDEKLVEYLRNCELYFDEDPINIKEFRALIVKIKEQGLSISHTGHSLGALIAEFTAAYF